MTPLETALVILITLQSLVFILVGVSVVVIVLQIKKSIDKVNSILEDTHQMTNDLGGSLKTIASGFAMMSAKGMVGNLIQRFTGKSAKKKS